MRHDEVALNNKEKVVVFGRFMKKLLKQPATIFTLLFITPAILAMIFGNFTSGGVAITGGTHIMASILVGLGSSLVIMIIFMLGYILIEVFKDSIKPFLKDLYNEEADQVKKEILENVERKHLLK